MKKKIIIVNILICVVLFLFVCCKNNNNILDVTNEYISDGNYHWKVNQEDKKEAHNFNNNVCDICKLYYNKTLFAIFGNDAIVYRNTNPYNINLDDYGSNVSVVFYKPDIYKFNDKYNNVDKEKFYSDYKISNTYEDAYYRTKHGLISGEKEPLDYLVNKDKRLNDNIKITDATYVLDYNGEYIGYFTNSLDNKSKPIWYSGAYVTHDDVSAYLLAFGEVPPNSRYKKTPRNGRRESVDTWGEFGRLNYSYYVNDRNKYPFEPSLPTGKYIETDYGNASRFMCGSVEQVPYIVGNKIIRGTCRFVFSDGHYEKKIDKRHVFYTYNHYNDFEEYLNYDKGYGKIFGFETAGNECILDSKDIKYIDFVEPTKYPTTVGKSILEICK